MAKVSFNNKEKAFYSSLSLSVSEYFENNRLKRTGNAALYSKTVILFFAAIALYLSLLFFKMPWWLGILLSGIFGFVLATIGFNVMHDACHGSFSSRKWINYALGLSLNALGGNSFIWKFKHNILHHTYPNIDGIDDDIAKSPLLRQSATQKWLSMHKFQHLYVIVVYAITSVAWVFFMDFQKYFRRRVVDTPLPKMVLIEHFIFWLTKLFYLLFYIVIPVFIVGWQKWALGYVSFNVVMGLTLSIVFQLAHVVEHTKFESVVKGSAKRIENEWAIYQINATANFATSNAILSWLVGGLNFQVEHHLFPRISHVHYLALNKIVKQKCLQFDVCYNEFPTMTTAIISHFRMMKEFGKKPQILL